MKKEYITANQQFEKWYEENKDKLKENTVGVSDDYRVKHTANMAYIEGYFDGIKENK